MLLADDLSPTSSQSSSLAFYGTMSNPLTALDEYEASASTAISQANSADDLEAVRIEYLGKKKGRLKDLQSLIGKASPDDRPVLGKRFNQIKGKVTSLLEKKKAELAKPVKSKPSFDPTLPGDSLSIGKRHPILQTIEEFQDLMGRLGFEPVHGPEIEDEYHNFDALNIPREHPARDPLDNFYLSAAESSSGGPLLLRSQTSTVQIRVMEKTDPPIRIVSLGRVYRPDTPDDTHSPMFHQMEGLLIDRSVTMADLKTILHLFITSFLGNEMPLRFRPSFFPFTEPSVEVDVFWQGEKWMEIGGAGMVDPNVLNSVGYDSEEVSGFAFGLGIERICMARYGITDIRNFYQNDLRFLRQF